jgi:hypothetical protein
MEVCRFRFRLQQTNGSLLFPFPFATNRTMQFCLQQTNGVCRFRFRLQQTNASLLFPFAAYKRSSRFPFSFAANKWKLPFSVSYVSMDVETW